MPSGYAANLVVNGGNTVYCVKNFISILEYVKYRQTSNIRCTFVGNIIVYHSDVVGATPVGAAPTTSSFST